MQKLMFLLLLLFSTTFSMAQAERDDLEMTAYIIVSDTSKNYFELQQKMYALQDASGLKIDTMSRTYNIEKDLICLPGDDIDEIYASSYFPRRFPDASLSLEYLKFYDLKSSEKNIALVCGIFSTKAKAEAHLENLSRSIKGAFIIQKTLSMNCMH